MKFKPGDTVRVVGSRGTAKIRAILTSMHGALRVRWPVCQSFLVMPTGVRK
jgi:hypothetical protein